MVELATALMVIQTISLTIGVIYYIITLQNSNRNQKHQLETRQAQLFMQIFSHQYNIEQRKSIELIKNMNYENFDDFEKKYGEKVNPETFIRLSSLGSYYEGIGVLVKKGLVDPEMVDDLMSGRIIEYWDIIGPWVIETRQRTGYYEMSEHLEFLYNKIKMIRNNQRTQSGLPIV